MGQAFPVDKENVVKISMLALTPMLAGCLWLPAAALAQAAGGAVLGVTQTVAAEVAHGWNVKKSILGKDVYNDAAKPEVVGKIDDIIINPKGAVSYAIVNASKFLGLSSHDVMIPVEQFQVEDARITLPGASKDALRAMPVFRYAPHAGKALK